MKLNWITIFILLILIIFIIWVVVLQIEEYYLQNDPKLDELRDILEPLFTKNNYSGVLESLNNRNILEDIGLYNGKKSYTINKEKVFLCLTDKNNKYYNNNLLIYVLLHEISHCICDEIGHTEKFHEIFEAILNEAVKEGIYNPSIPIIQDYCSYND
jgi:hypothetical protein